MSQKLVWVLTELVEDEVDGRLGHESIDLKSLFE